MFAVDDAAYDWADVALAAALWGEWTALEHQVAEGLAWCSGAPEAGPPVDAEAVRDRGRRFRQRRRLLAADDMQAWLERWQLTASAWTEYLRRTELRHRVGHASRPASLPDTEELATAIHAEAVCSGRLEAWAQQLAGRAAVHAAAPRPAADNPTAPPDDLRPHGLPPLPADILQRRTLRLRALECSWTAFERAAVTDGAIAAEVRARQLDWIRVDCQAVTLAAEDAAREVALTLRRRERSLDDVAGDAGVQVVRRTVRLDAASAELAVKLVGAGPGDVLGPIPQENGFLVLEVLARTPPSPDDPTIGDEAARRVLDRAVRQLVNDRVVWHEHL